MYTQLNAHKYTVYRLTHSVQRCRAPLTPLHSHLKGRSSFRLETSETETSWAKKQKPAKNDIQNSVKLTDHTCYYNDLTNFEYQVRTMTGNGSYVNMRENAGKSVKKICETT